RRGQAAHRAGPDDEHVASGQRVLARTWRAEAGGGEIDRGAQQAEAGPAYRGLGPGPLAGAQCEPAELAEHPPGRAVLRRQLDGRTHLAEDLVLADHHRVEAG